MSINLNPDASILIGGIVKTSANNPLTLDPAQEADLINRGIAVYATPPASLGGGLVPAMLQIEDGYVTGLVDPSTGVNFALSVSPSRTLFGLPAPVVLAPSGSVAANGALTLGTTLTQTFSGGCWMYFPSGAVYAGSAAGLYWVVMSSGTAGIIYDTINNGYINRPSTVTPIAAAGPGAFTGVTGSAIDLCKFDVPDGLVIPGDSVRLAFSVLHTNSANNKSYSVKAGANGMISPVWTTNDGWNAELRFYCIGHNQVTYPQGWVPAADQAHNVAAYLVGTNRTVSLTANRAVATEVVKLVGMSCVHFPASA